PMSLGQQMAQARKRITMTQDQMADHLGVHRNTVGRWERGLEGPGFDVVVRLAGASGWPHSLFERAMATNLPRDGPDGPGGQEISSRGCNGGDVIDMEPRRSRPPRAAQNAA